MLMFIGMLVVSATLAMGVYWFITRIRLSKPRNYKYEKFTSETGETLEKVIEAEDEKT